MEAAPTCFFCGGIPATARAKVGAATPTPSTLLFRCNASYVNVPLSSSFGSFCLLARNSSISVRVRSLSSSSGTGTGFIRNAAAKSSGETKLSPGPSYAAKRRRRRSGLSSPYPQPQPPEEDTNSNTNSNSSSSNALQNGDPLGWKDLGKSVVRWIRQSMRAMASDFASAELQGELEFSELRQRMGPGLTFVIQAQPYLNAVPMPLGLEVMCLKACTHYPTLFDHFQRELRDVLQELQSKSLLQVQDWRHTQSWKLLKELANSGFFFFLFSSLLFTFHVTNMHFSFWSSYHFISFHFIPFTITITITITAEHRAVARKIAQPQQQPKTVQGVLGMDVDKVKAMQHRIDDFTTRMSELLRIERDAELEFTQEELDAVPRPNDTSDPSKPIEFLVSHSQPHQELCDTICNLNAISTSTGILLFLFSFNLSAVDKRLSDN